MKKIALALSALCISLFSLAQSDTLTPMGAAARQPQPAKRDWSKLNMANRANDHFMIQIGYDKWAGQPDSIKTKGLSRSINAYFMLDFPFKTDPRFSIGLGVGVSGSSIFFDKMTVGVAGSTTRLWFRNVADTNHFKKYKLATTYAEVPVELRYAVDPEHNGKSWKFAVGAKIGTIINVHTRGKTLQNKAGSTINAYTLKENSKRYFNGTRLAATGRIGYGLLSIFGTYQVNQFLKEGLGPEIHPYSIGIGLSGL